MYAKLKGKVPAEPTVREVALTEELAKCDLSRLDALAEEYNKLLVDAAKLADDAKALKVRIDARKILILKRLNEIGGDGVKGLHGFTWSEANEPYPICDDPTAVVEYFKTHGMEDQLTLKKSEINSRLEAHVKAEAMRGELIVETTTEKDPVTNEDREVTVVRSQIPGVRVYLDSKLSRVKSAGPRKVKLTNSEGDIA